jgi:UDP-GlcNAc:undecaprenyl-phosphate GlcNAc-1-phosphate transferase
MPLLLLIPLLVVGLFALWVLLLPLADCVSLMARRIRKGKSPFDGDRDHIHHYLLARGFTHSQTLAILVGVSALFGLAGYLGWKLELPEPLLFWTFAGGFFAYHFWIRAAWRRLEHADRGLGRALPPPPDEEPKKAVALS